MGKWSAKINRGPISGGNDWESTIGGLGTVFGDAAQTAAGRKASLGRGAQGKQDSTKWGPVGSDPGPLRRNTWPPLQGALWENRGHRKVACRN